MKRQRRHIFWYLLAAAFFHLLLFFAIPQSAVLERNKYEVIEFAIHEKPATSSDKDSGRAHTQVTDLVPRNFYSDSRQFVRNEKYLSVENKKTKTDLFQDKKPIDTYKFLAGPLHIMGENKNWAFHEYLFYKIDSELIFDSILAQYNHFGKVFIEFAVSKDGTLLADQLKVETTDRVLKVHVLRALRRALKKPFPREKWAEKPEDLVISAKFMFMQDNPEWNFQKQKSFGQPVFVFRRATFEKPIPGNLKDHLLSGGIDPDLFKMYERWQKYNKKKERERSQYDPFIEYRLDPDYNI